MFINKLREDAGRPWVWGEPIMQTLANQANSVVAKGNAIQERIEALAVDLE